MQYGEHYQTQKYTYGVGRISIDFIELDDKDNGWIPKTAPTRLEEEYQRLYYLEDELGSTKRLISEEGKVSVSYKYYDFGTPSTSTHFDVNWPGPDNLFGYTGYEWDNIAEMWYAKARYYNSDLGRFVAEDPVKGSILDIQSLNLYPYVKNNPLKYIDPDGRKPETIEAEAEDWTGCGPTLMEAADMAAHIYSGEVGDFTLGGWRLIEVYENDTLRMGVYKRRAANGKEEYVIANAGTDASNIPGFFSDMKKNAQQHFFQSPDVLNSIKYVEKFVIMHPDSSITFVGHSKGGAEAAANAVATNKNAILFNPAEYKLEAHGLNSSKYTGKMTTYIVENEILDIIFNTGEKSIGKVEYLPEQYPIIEKPSSREERILNYISLVFNHFMEAVKDGIREKGWEKRR